MADPNDQEVSNPQGIRSGGSGASESSEHESYLSTARPSSRESQYSEAAGSPTSSSRPGSGMSLAPAEASIAARFGAPKTELELSKLILWISELDSLEEEPLSHNVHQKIDILRNRIMYEISHPVWNAAGRLQ